MKLAIDVHYQDDSASVAGILFNDWHSPDCHKKVNIQVSDIEPYIPGSFYKRELPCILALLQKVSEDIEIIIIDGYVTLGEEEKPGLGAHLFQHLKGEIPIIGVAKNRFTNTPDQCALFRGASKKPLFITCLGIELVDAKQCIQTMHGQHRIPTLLKLADSECRQAIQDTNT